jgi:oxygen-independent coproporphyrinogen III oxidase
MTPALYIHIPFCKRKCNYCDFVSYAGKEDLIDDYVEVLCKEITALTRQHETRPPLPLGEGNNTIFFGGGTPTLFEPRHFEKILLSTPYPLPPEVSVEANPGTANLAKLKALRQLGINRISIGVQSFNDKHLKTLGRIHDAETAQQFYRDARAAGFDNINLDLMFALPGQTLSEWQADIKTALSLKPDHLSIYNLKIEEGTPFHLQLTTYNLQLPSEDLEATMFEHAIDTLTAHGYTHYEISNFAKPGKECQHNINYWENGNYLGVGAGAHSHLNGQRWSNPNCIEAYLKTASRITHNETRLAPDQRETLFLGLRLLAGIPISNFTGFEKEVAELIKDGLLEQKNGNYRLTRHGLFLGNIVFEKFV